jgi:hypothetical protein
MGRKWRPTTSIAAAEHFTAIRKDVSMFVKNESANTAPAASSAQAPASPASGAVSAQYGVVSPEVIVRNFQTPQELQELQDQDEFEKLYEQVVDVTDRLGTRIHENWEDSACSQGNYEGLQDYWALRRRLLAAALFAAR